MKDKSFSEQDVRHAADKVAAAGKNHINFIIGRHGSSGSWDYSQCVNEYLSKGFVLNIVPVDCVVLTLLGLIDDTNISVDRFTKYILNVAINTKFKEKTVDFISRIADEYFGDG